MRRDRLEHSRICRIGLIALMNDGMYQGRQVIPADVLQQTMQPAIGLPNTAAEQRGYWEMLNAAYGMGRQTASYRGHLITYHGGDLPGFHSQVSFMPKEKIGVIVLVVGNHTAPLYNYVSYNVYERLLGMDQTPWIQRGLDIRLKGKEAGIAARKQAGEDRVPNTKPSHALADYVGEYENAAYGSLKIGLKNNELQFDFHKIAMPLGALSLRPVRYAERRRERQMVGELPHQSAGRYRRRRDVARRGGDDVQAKAGEARAGAAHAAGR